MDSVTIALIFLGVRSVLIGTAVYYWLGRSTAVVTPFKTQPLSL
jgi:hypothetical protein